MEQSEMQTKDESSIEEDYVRLLHCPNAILEMLRSQVRKSSPVIATQYKTQQLYPCIQTLPRDKATIYYQSSNTCLK